MSQVQEGSVNRCPRCQEQLSVVSTGLYGETSCGKCEAPLWYLNLSPRTYFFERAEAGAVQERVVAVVAHQLGVDRHSVVSSKSVLTDLGADSLDTMEIAIRLEDELSLR